MSYYLYSDILNSGQTSKLQEPARIIWITDWTFIGLQDGLSEISMTNIGHNYSDHI